MLPWCNGRAATVARLAILLAAFATIIATTSPAIAQVPEEPGVRVRSVEVLGLEGVATPDRLPPLPLRPGVEYTLPRLLSTEHRLLRFLAELGHANAQIESSAEIPPGERVADVRFEVAPGPRMVFDTVFVAVEPPLTEAEVRRRLLVRAGDPVSPAALETSIARLERLAIVQRVLVDARPIPGAEERLATSIAVSTLPAQGPGLSGGFSSAQCLDARVGWLSRYFLGAPRTFSISGGGANLLAGPLRRFPCTGAGEGEFADPDYLLRSELGQPIGPATWLFVSGEVSRSTAARAYIRRGIQGRVAIAHELGRGWDGLAAYAPERSDNPGAAPILCGLNGICDAGEIVGATTAAVHAPLELAAAWRTPNIVGVLGAAPTSPPWMHPVRRPWRLAVRGAVTTAGPATLSRFTYGSAVLDGSGARLLGPRVELAARLRVGVLDEGDDPVPPQVRLYGGGPAGVRGAAPNLLGPKILTMTAADAEELGDFDPAGDEPIDPRRVRLRPTGGELLVEANLEMRVRALRWLELAAFTDYGFVRSGADALAPAARHRTEALFSPGIGALLLLPVGPLRVDVAYDPSPARRYPLLVPDEDGSQRFLGEALYDPFTFDAPSRSREIRRRLQLQLSIGHPF